MEKTMLRTNIKINDNGFVFAFDLGMTFTANASGVEILKMLQLGYTKEQVKSSMMDTFGISDQEFEKDYHDFLVQLKNLKLLL